MFAILGLSGAALFLNLYKTTLLWFGILMNLFGTLPVVENLSAATGV